jgi:hypothetical protein
MKYGRAMGYHTHWHFPINTEREEDNKSREGGREGGREGLP